MTDNNELILRIELIRPRLKDVKKACAVAGFVSKFTQPCNDCDALLDDCRAAILQQKAEIEFKQQVNDNLRDHLAEKQAEIERLTTAREATILVRNNQSRQIDELRDEIERLEENLTRQKEYYENVIQDGIAQIRIGKERIAELEKPYVPMTDNDWALMYKNGIWINVGSYDVERAAEAAVVKRANLEVAK